MAMNWPLAQQGSTGENVRSIQYLLNARRSNLVVDEILGSKTTAAVRVSNLSMASPWTASLVTRPGLR